MSDLTKAILIATKAHAGQVDKGGAPYILHPLRVMLAVEGEEAKIVAVLHDVVEDTDVTHGDLRREGFSPTIVEAVKALTRHPAETYEEFMGRVICNDLARIVKVADMTDNADLSRIAEPSSTDIARAAKYRHYIAKLAA